MLLKDNPGLDPKEIEQLKAECKADGKKFVYFEDELGDEPDNVEEFVHVQFVGNYKGQEAIFDAVIYSLRLHFNSHISNNLAIGTSPPSRQGFVKSESECM